MQPEGEDSASTQLLHPTAKPSECSLLLPTAKPSDESSLCARTFLLYAREELGDSCLLLSFKPLPDDMVGGQFLAPSQGENHLDLTSERDSYFEAWLLQSRKLVIGVCTCGDRIDCESAPRIIEQLHQFQPVILIALLLPSACDRKLAGTILKQQDELMDMGIADVIVGPTMKPGHLRHAVDLMLATHKADTCKAHQLLKSEPLMMHPKELAELKCQHSSILWDDVLEGCMPTFPRVNESLPVHSMGVGNYEFLRKFICKQGRVVLARAGGGPLVVMKVINKSEVTAPQQLENIHREHRFLHGVLAHPNIVKCLELLHAKLTFYIVFEFAGHQNLEQFCEKQKGRRLPQEQAIDCFKQVVGALAYMHGVDIAHRSLALHHVVLKKLATGLIHCTLVDFHCAVLAKGDTASSIICADLPCISPEMAMGHRYIPRFVDSWSVGIMLLEISGGLNSFAVSVGLDTGDVDVDAGVQAIVDFFDSPGSHEEALGKLGGVSSAEIAGYLKALVVYPPGKRMQLTDLAKSWEESSRT